MKDTHLPTVLWQGHAWEHGASLGMVRVLIHESALQCLQKRLFFYISENRCSTILGSSASRANKVPSKPCPAQLSGDTDPCRHNQSDLTQSRPLKVTGDTNSFLRGHVPQGRWPPKTTHRGLQGYLAFAKTTSPRGPP